MLGLAGSKETVTELIEKEPLPLGSRKGKLVGSSIGAAEMQVVRAAATTAKVVAKRILKRIKSVGRYLDRIV